MPIDGCETASQPQVGSGDLLECDCWKKANERLKTKGYKIADVCSVLRITDDMGFTTARGLPLARADGAKMKRDDPQMVEVSHCPFCGAKYPDGKAF